MVVLIGFSLLGALCGAFFAVFGSIVGFAYQLVKALSIFVRVLFKCEAKYERRHPPKSPMPILDVNDAIPCTMSCSETSDQLLAAPGPRRTLCCIRLPNTCP